MDGYVYVCGGCIGSHTVEIQATEPILIKLMVAINQSHVGDFNQI